MSDRFEEQNADPDEHNDCCDHNRPLIDAAGREMRIPYESSRGTCAECGAKDCCVGCRSSDFECYCEPEEA